LLIPPEVQVRYTSNPARTREPSGSLHSSLSTHPSKQIQNHFLTISEQVIVILMNRSNKDQRTFRSINKGENHMNGKKLLPLIATGALALITVLGVATYQTVKAEAATANPAQTSSSLGSITPVAQLLSNNTQMVNFGRGFAGGSSDQDLATALGIDLTKLQTAYQTATAAALKQAVSAGVITQSQADQFTARGSVLRAQGETGWLTSNGIDYNSLLADALGINVDKLQSAYLQAYTTNLDSAVKSGYMTQQEADLAKAQYALANSSKFQAALQPAYQAALKQAVTDGTITQSQADQITKSDFGSGMGFPGLNGSGGHGGPGGFGGGRGGFGGQDFMGGAPSNSTNPAPAAPTATPSGSGL
jgi:hypothetical protein